MSNFHSKMPAAIPRAHFEPPWRGDSLGGVLVASHRPHRAGFEPAIDLNFTWTGSKAWNIHWATPIQNNYRYLRVGAKVRRMTLRELRRPASKWGDRVGDWRRTKSIHSARPHTYAFMVEYAKKHHVIVVAELKSPSFATSKAARYLVESARQADHPPWFMSLYNMKDVRGKALFISRAGGQFAVIFGKFRGLSKHPPKDWAHWSQYVTQVWGGKWGSK